MLIYNIHNIYMLLILKGILPTILLKNVAAKDTICVLFLTKKTQNYILKFDIIV
jgi:hypothetical protein